MTLSDRLKCVFKPLFFTLLGALSSGAWAASQPLALEPDAWRMNPLVWQLQAPGLAADIPGEGFAIYQAAPCASNVTLQAQFTPQATANKNWHVAGVAIVDDENNFWHLAIIQSPPGAGAVRSFELAEMRHGHWLAHLGLKQEEDAGTRQAWEFGATYHFLLTMDRQGISGTIQDSQGGILFRRRFAFDKRAVARGRPALRLGGFSGAFKDVRGAWSIPCQVARPVWPPYRAAPSTLPAQNATGFFRVAQLADQRWWCIDPLGHPMVLLGIDHVTFNGHWCETLGYAPHGRKNQAKYASHEVWQAETLQRLTQWGFNLLGAGCEPRLRHQGLAHTEFLNIGEGMARLGDAYDITPHEDRPCSAFPNVFHPQFEAYCHYMAQKKCAPLRDDPWLLGYFIDNELAWWGRGARDIGLCDAVMRKAPTHSAKSALQAFLAAACEHDLARFNALWQTNLSAWEEFLTLASLPTATQAQRAAKQAFTRLTAERYFKTVAQAVRAADPHHLLLGARFAGYHGADDCVWQVAGLYNDIVSFNTYPMVDLDEGLVYDHLGAGRRLASADMARYHQLSARPLFVTEWSFPALDSGLPCQHGAGQRFLTQTERTRATSLFARTMLSQPGIIGYDYFMWVDEPALGISAAFPEDSNYGLINEDGVVYPEITAMFTALHRTAARQRSAPPPAAQAPPPPLPTAAQFAALTPPAAATSFVRQDQDYRVDNGRLQLSGTVGGRHLFEKLELDGKPSLGHYGGMLQLVDDAGGYYWCEVSRVDAVKGAVEEGVAQLEITASGIWREHSFTLTQRLWIPPQTPWFLAEITAFANTGTQALKVQALYFRLFSPPCQALTPPRAPNLWGLPTSGAWLNTDTGAFAGLMAAQRSGIGIYFWLREERWQHPDARFAFEMPLLLAPQARHVLPAPPFVLCQVGYTGARGWQEAQDVFVCRLESFKQP